MVVGFLLVNVNWKTLLQLRLLELRTIFGLVEPARNTEQVAAIEAAGGFRSLVGCHESINHLSLGVCVIIGVVRFHKRHPQHDTLGNAKCDIGYVLSLLMPSKALPH